MQNAEVLVNRNHPLSGPVYPMSKSNRCLSFSPLELVAKLFTIFPQPPFLATWSRQNGCKRVTPDFIASFQSSLSIGNEYALSALY